MNTIAWILILAALIIARAVGKGRVTNLPQDLSDGFRTLITGDSAGLTEVLSRQGETLGYTTSSTISGAGTTVGAAVSKAIGGIGWHLDPHLNSIVDSVKAAHPGIDIGTIGDAAHQKRQSDHNPDANGIVHAADFMIGPHFTASDARKLADQFASSGDPKIKYVIYDHRIWQNGSWHAYSGSDPHTSHVHLSVR